MNAGRLAILLVCLGSAGVCLAAPPNEKPAPSDAKTSQTQSGAAKSTEKAGQSTGQGSPKPAPKYISESLRGKVVWLAEAVARKHGVRLDADAAETVAALETPDGELIPLMKEDRGRGFWKDARLRGVDLELVVRRYKGVPVVQVIRVYRLKEGKKYEVDYWCDVCAIQMFELKQCECCQGPTRLRERLVEEKDRK